ncbi:MAG: Uma2 family endonuclease [Armatimonadota bacterium]|nr:Uma2 family endonuclease [Armatimonadota bacterium]
MSPDASWVRRDRWDALTREQQEGFAPLCPDVVFEIASPSEVRADLRDKMHLYLRNGCRMAVLIDPQRRVVEVYAPQHVPQVHTAVRSLAFDPTLPGFALDLTRIFE